MKRLLAALACLAAVCACQGNEPPRPTPTPSPTAAPCPDGQSLLSEADAGWQFCHPTSWRFSERHQPSQQPAGLDITLDVAVIADCSHQPCAAPTACSELGLATCESRGFAFVIVGSYERDPSQSLADWVHAHTNDTDLQAIEWGNAKEAVQATGTDRRYALTQNRVIMLDVRAGQEQTGFDQMIDQSLPSWRFSV